MEYADIDTTVSEARHFIANVGRTPASQNNNADSGIVFRSQSVEVLHPRNIEAIAALLDRLTSVGTHYICQLKDNYTELFTAWPDAAGVDDRVHEALETTKFCDAFDDFVDCSIDAVDTMATFDWRSAALDSSSAPRIAELLHDSGKLFMMMFLLVPERATTNMVQNVSNLMHLLVQTRLRAAEDLLVYASEQTNPYITSNIHSTLIPGILMQMEWALMVPQLIKTETFNEAEVLNRAGKDVYSRVRNKTLLFGHLVPQQKPI